MSDIYENLARHLDNLPGGFPATESRVELRILKRLFTREEAELAVCLTMMPEGPGAIAARTGLEAAAIAPMLETMSRKGLIFRISQKGKTPIHRPCTSWVSGSITPMT